MQSMNNTEDLDVLFELFKDDFSNDDVHESLSESDETSSESSGSTGHSTGSSGSPPLSHISTYFPAPSTVVFAPNPLGSTGNHDTDCGDPSSKRSKTEEKLLRNRQSANKSRLKRKHEKMQLEDTVAELRERVRVLEMENNALLTDNTTLSQHNFFLQSMLKKQQEESSGVQALTSSHNGMSAIGGISMLCIVFSVSFFNDWLPSSLQGLTDGNKDGSGWSVEQSSGRVLLGMGDELNSDYISLVDSSHTRAMFHYALLLGSMFIYYVYHQYSDTLQKKSTRILPS